MLMTSLQTREGSRGCGLGSDDSDDSAPMTDTVP